MGQIVSITTASVPNDYCPTSFAAAWAFGVGLLSAELAGSNFSFNFGSTTPSPNDQDKPWFRTNADGTPDRIYVYSNGKWISLHPTAPGIANLYFGSAASIDTLDGGEAGTVSPTTGPMWQRKVICDAKFLVGVGTFASGATVAVTGTGGEETHVLTRAELPDVQIETESKKRTNVQDGGSADVYVPDTVTGSFALDTPLKTDALGDGDPHNNLPPYVGVFVIERTARLYYRL